VRVEHRAGSLVDCWLVEKEKRGRSRKDKKKKGKESKREMPHSVSTNKQYEKF